VSTLPTFCSFPFANELELILSLFLFLFPSRVTYSFGNECRFASNRFTQNSITAERHALARAALCRLVLADSQFNGDEQAQFTRLYDRTVV